MCGIAGIFSPELAHSQDSLSETVRSMAFAIRHRGPDDAGAWVDAPAGLALGHARLAILDLSAAGHQPMVGASGRYVIAFNGEIYNHLELRAELEKLGSVTFRHGEIDGSGALPGHVSADPLIKDMRPVWRGHSDTETLLAAVERWGLEHTLQKCVGMFALALWDREQRHLTLARDRFGEKPLYYGWVGNREGEGGVLGHPRALVFGSELKALRAHPSFNNPISRPALAQYLRFTHVPAPLSIYEGIYKLPPGTWLRVDAEFAYEPPLQAIDGPVPYWTLADVVRRGARAQIKDEVEAVEGLHNQLSEAVRLQSISDVPLGAFLSGGVDSSTIVALMQAQSSRPIQTFTVGFEEAGFDESTYAEAVAKHLGTDHHALLVTARETRDVIPQLPEMYDEPFADSSQIPTHLVCRAARQNVTVALSGDAGDELFGGYNRYSWGSRIWNKVGWIPSEQRQWLGAAVQGVSVATWDALGQIIGKDRVGDRAHKLASRLLSARNLDDVYWSLVTEWPGGDSLVKGLTHREYLDETTALRSEPPEELVDAAERMMFRDALTYFPDDILCKVDRAAMSVSLETRVPFLDHRIAELAWCLPLNMKIRGGESKWLLRQVLYQYVPRPLIERPKAGFGIPVGQWLRGPLRDWAEALLDEARILREGFFHPAPIRKAWTEHLSAQRDWTPRLWAVLMFQAWLEKQ
jgi:asparagine synthase (glutamine-hydrolysing)